MLGNFHNAGKADLLEVKLRGKGVVRSLAPSIFGTGGRWQNRVFTKWEF